MKSALMGILVAAGIAAVGSSPALAQKTSGKLQPKNGLSSTANAVQMPRFAGDQQLSGEATELRPAPGMTGNAGVIDSKVGAVSDDKANAQ